MEVEYRKKKISKFDSLKPLLSLLEGLLIKGGLDQQAADSVVIDIGERFVTAGYGWDKILQYQSKGEHLFSKKLIPHIFMSKDELPATLTPDEILRKMFKYIEDWKMQLYDMISFNASAMATEAQQEKIPVKIKEEPKDDDYIDVDSDPAPTPPAPVTMPKTHLITGFSKPYIVPAPVPPPVQPSVSRKASPPPAKQFERPRSRSPSPIYKRHKSKDKKKFKKPRSVVSTSRSLSPSPPTSPSRSRSPPRPAVKPRAQKPMTKKDFFGQKLNLDPGTDKYGLKEIKDIDPKTTCYEYGEKNPNDGRSPSEKKSLLDKVSAILDNSLHDKYPPSKDGKKSKNNGSSSKEIILNKDSNSVTVIGNPRQSRRSRSFSPYDPNKRPIRSLSQSPRPRSRSRTPSQYRSSRRHESPPRRHERSPPRRQRSWSRSPQRQRYRSRSPPYRRYWSRSRSRSRSPWSRMPTYTRPMWIAVSPVQLEDDLKMERNSVREVACGVRDQFCFPSNTDCRVKICKWTGRDSVTQVNMKPQFVTLEDENKLSLTLENPFYDRELRLRKHEKVGCLSILSSPLPRSVRCVTPDRFQTSTDRWFRVTRAVLHRKGQLDRILIHPGKIMKVYATLKGAVKKYVGLEVLVTEIDNEKCPIDPQVCRILENDCIGFTVMNRGKDVLRIEKDGQHVAYISVWSKQDLSEEGVRQ